MYETTPVSQIFLQHDSGFGDDSRYTATFIDMQFHSVPKYMSPDDSSLYTFRKTSTVLTVPDNYPAPVNPATGMLCKNIFV